MSECVQRQRHVMRDQQAILLFHAPVAQAQHPTPAPACVCLQVPIMLKSLLCSIKDMNDRELMEVGECPYDQVCAGHDCRVAGVDRSTGVKGMQRGSVKDAVGTRAGGEVWECPHDQLGAE